MPYVFKYDLSIVSKEKFCSILFFAVSPMVLRVCGLVVMYVRHSDRLCISPGAIVNPLWRSSISSGFPPTLVATQVRPEAIASNKLRDRPSEYEGRTKRLAAVSKAGMSSRKPRKRV